MIFFWSTVLDLLQSESLIFCNGYFVLVSSNLLNIHSVAISCRYYQILVTVRCNPFCYSLFGICKFTTHAVYHCCGSNSEHFSFLYRRFGWLFSSRWCWRGWQFQKSCWVTQFTIFFRWVPSVFFKRTDLCREHLTAYWRNYWFTLYKTSCLPLQDFVFRL